MKQCKTQKPTCSILNASFRSIYSDLPQAKSVTGLLNTEHVPNYLKLVG